MTKPLTIEELRANAASKAHQLAGLDQPAYPLPEPEPAKPTLAERWAEFWRNRRIAQLRQRIQIEQALIDELPEVSRREIEAAEDALALRLQEISANSHYHRSISLATISKARAELRTLGAL